MSWRCRGECHSPNLLGLTFAPTRAERLGATLPPGLLR